MSNNFLDQFYTIDPESGDYIIEVNLENYDDIFNTWDSSVYNIRDLDSSLKSFLEECSHDIKSQNNIQLRFNMQKQERNIDMEKNIEKGIRNYFNYILYTTKRDFLNIRNKVFLYIIVSVLFTTLSFYLQISDNAKVINEIISLSVTVSGWVFLWEAFSLIFIQSSDLWKKRKQYKRILSAPIVYRYH